MALQVWGNEELEKGESDITEKDSNPVRNVNLFTCKSRFFATKNILM